MSRHGAFEERVGRHAGIPIRVARTYCRNQEDRRDLVQEIHVNLWLAFPKYNEAQPFATWMYRIALNTAVSWTRREKVRQRPLPPTSTIEPEDDRELQLLHEMIDGLDAAHRALLLLYLDDLTYAEIGEILGLSEGNVGARLTRLKQQLRRQINQKDDNNGT